MTKTITPTPSPSIRNWHARWHACKEGPLALATVESIHDEAKARAERLQGARFGDGKRIYRLTGSDKRAHDYCFDVWLAAASLYDALNGEDIDLDEARDEFESLLEQGHD